MTEKSIKAGYHITLAVRSSLLRYAITMYM